MAQIKLYTWQGAEAGMFELPDSLFAVAVKPAVVHEVIVAQDANSRVIHAHTKDRSEVSGGGKKPWKQKGTGRARHGSTRSPIWVHGGVAHGPQADRNFTKKVNKKMKRTAIAMLLSDRLAQSSFVAVDTFALPEAKTKLVAAMRKALPCADRSALLVLSSTEVGVARAARNLSNTQTIAARSVNPRDLAKFGAVIASKAAIAEMEETFTG
jgi:large subunit ribosomal protein L4